MPERSRLADIAVLIVLLAVCLGIGSLSGAVTASSVGTWYPTLAKPSFNPPDYVFAPVWTTLFVLMAIAAWRVWRAADWPVVRLPLVLFALQLALNVGWSVAFFGLQNVGLAVLVIAALDLAVLATMAAFRPVDRIAALLLVPYLAWIAFATVLNVAIWRLNQASAS